MRRTIADRAWALACAALLAGALLAPAATADGWKPATKEHHEVFRSRRGVVLRHFAWKVTPEVSRRGDVVRVTVHEPAEVLEQRFAGVAGEIEFAGPHTSVWSVEVTTSEGGLHRARGATVEIKGGGGSVTSVVSQHVYLGRTWQMSWSIVDAMSPAEREAHLGRVIGDISAAPVEGRRSAYAVRRAELMGLSATRPEVRAAIRAADLRLASEDAAAEVSAALAELAALEGGAGLDKDKANELAAKMVSALARVDAAAPNQPSMVYKVAKALERLNKLGLAHAEYFKQKFGETEPAALKFAEKALNYVKAADSLAAMADQGRLNVDRFIDDTIKVLPKEAIPALASPTGVFFRDTMKWNEKMWDETTAGLNVVADAIASGNVDGERLAAITGRLETLAKEGPWGADTGKSFAKKFVEGIPVVGKLLSALW